MFMFLLLCLHGLQYVSANSSKSPKLIEELLHKTEPLELEFCKGLGYNVTPQINFLQENQHTARRNANFKALLRLSKTRCSRLVIYFACSLHAPPPLAVYGALPPCKSFCHAVTKSCAKYLRWASRHSSYTGSCKLTKKGSLYRGKESETKGGIPCQKWSSQSPHRHSFQPINYKSQRLRKNYCRNPDDEPEGPWCYTTSKKTRWDYCDVPMCSVHLHCNLLSNDGCIYYAYDKIAAEYQLKVKGKPNKSNLKRWITGFSKERVNKVNNIPK